MIEAARNTNLKVIPGTGSNSTREALRLTERAAELGAHACLVVTPYYNKPSPEGVLAHFQELDKVGIPLILYNTPSRTGIDLGVDLIILKKSVESNSAKKIQHKLDNMFLVIVGI